MKPESDEHRLLTIKSYMDIPSAGVTLPGTGSGGNTDDEPEFPFDPDAKTRDLWDKKGLW